MHIVARYFSIELTWILTLAINKSALWKFETNSRDVVLSSRYDGNIPLIVQNFGLGRIKLTLGPYKFPRIHVLIVIFEKILRRISKRNLNFSQMSLRKRGQIRVVSTSFLKGRKDKKKKGWMRVGEGKRIASWKKPIRTLMILNAFVNDPSRWASYIIHTRLIEFQIAVPSADTPRVRLMVDLIKPFGEDRSPVAGIPMILMKVRRKSSPCCD